jgi:hypothetical protein
MNAVSASSAMSIIAGHQSCSSGPHSWQSLVALTLRSACGLEIQENKATAGQSDDLVGMPLDGLGEPHEQSPRR